MGQPYNPESYWDEVAGNIAARQDTRLIAGDDEPYYRYKRKRFLELLGRLPLQDKKILEIGSGPGGNLEFLHRNGCRSLTGADISARMIALATELLGGKNINLVKIDGRRLPFEDGSFDVVFTSTVLQHITDENILLPLLSEICRVSSTEVLLFERIERHIKGHESNLGRPVSYYTDQMAAHNFVLKTTTPLPLQASFYACGAIRKLANPSHRKEGEPLTKLSVALEKMVLPFTSMLDKIIPSNRDVMLLHFVRRS
jgi:ubiquinone/menaquinone biosynthesis C-methylase UbiE